MSKFISVFSSLLAEQLFGSESESQKVKSLLAQGARSKGGSMPDKDFTYSSKNNNPRYVLEKFKIDNDHVNEFWSMFDSTYRATAQHAFIFIAFPNTKEILGEAVRVHPYILDALATHGNFHRVEDLAYYMSHAVRVLGYPVNLATHGVNWTKSLSEKAIDAYENMLSLEINPKFAARWLLEFSDEMFLNISGKDFSAYGYTDRSFDLMNASEIFAYINNDISFKTAFRFSDAGYEPSEANEYIESGQYDADEPIPSISWYRSFSE